MRVESNRRRVWRASCSFAPALSWILCGALQAQAPFRDGIEGELYYANRIDRIAAADGGPLEINLDGNLEEAAWERAVFHTYTQHWPGGTVPTNDADSLPEFACVADDQYLYVAWRIADEARDAASMGCAAFNDDAIEIHIDANGEGFTCGTCSYQIDDAQILIGASQIDKDDPLLLEVGWVRGGGCVFAGPAVDAFTGDPIIQGVAVDRDAPDGLAGWQGEIAIALETMTYGEWSIDPIHGASIGWDVHFDDADDGDSAQNANNSALIWSVRDTTSAAWGNPGVFGKLQFITPGKPLASVARDISDSLTNGASGPVTLTVAPVYGEGTVVISEKLPAGFTPSKPSVGGTIANNTITWDLGKVTSKVVVSYTLAAGPDVEDGPMPGTATIDGEPLFIGGDRRYTGSPFTDLGFIKLWNHLGPLAWASPAAAADHGPPGACDGNGGTDLVADWVVNDDESLPESDMFPFPGLHVEPKYGGNGQPGGTGARAAGLVIAAGDTGQVSEDVFPVWKAGVSPGDTIDHASRAVNGLDADDHMTMSAIYVTNHTNAAIDTFIGLGSDDSIQVLLDDIDVTGGGIFQCRGWGAPNEEQNVLPVILPPGESKLLVKVLDGGGASGFRLRFQDPADPIGPGLRSPDITVSLESSSNPPPASVVRDFSSETFAIGDTIDVSLVVSTAGGARDVVVREVLPDQVRVDQISDSGAVKGNAIEWTLAGVTTKTVTYKLTPSTCRTKVDFTGSTWTAGSLEAFVTGKSTLTGALPVDEDLNAWESIDIGYTGGAAQPLGEHDVLVNALGNGVTLMEDQFRFIYLPVSGDFEISARVDCLEADGLRGAGGLMVRDTLDPTSANLFFFVGARPPLAGGVGSLGATLRRDTNLDRPTPSVPVTPRDVASLPVYIKMVRAGTTISLHRSANGTDYTQVGEKEIGPASTQVNLRADALVGLAVSGFGQGKATYTFRDVSGPSFTQTSEPGFHRGDADDNGDLQLTDAVRILGALFLGQGDIACNDAADADDNGGIQLTDAVRILGALFLGQGEIPLPGPPSEACGVDPTPDELGCASYTGC